MYKKFVVGNIHVLPYLMDHSAFDAAAFEITADDKTIIYSGDFRGHGRKGVCLDRFVSTVRKDADLLLIEGTMFGRQDEVVMTEQNLEDQLVEKIRNIDGPILFQSSSQNIDRLVSFYRAAIRMGKLFVVDVYTANVLFELRQLGNNQIPAPSMDYPNIKVFFPYRLTQKIFNEIGEVYAKRFSAFHMSKERLHAEQNNVVMAVRPSMKKDIEATGLQNGLFVYSMWNGYRANDYQKGFEETLFKANFMTTELHTSGHASIADIKRVLVELRPKQVVPIHTMVPDSFNGLSENVVIQEDGRAFEI